MSQIFTLTLSRTPNLSQDDDALDSIRARRNQLAGFWAGSLLGLQGEALGGYAEDLHIVDHMVSGDSDVIARMVSDFSDAGLTISEADIQMALRRFHLQALKDTGCTE